MDSKVRDSRGIVRHDGTLAHTKARAHQQSVGHLVTPGLNQEISSQGLAALPEYEYPPSRESYHGPSIEIYEDFSEPDGDGEMGTDHLIVCLRLLPPCS